MVASNSAPLGSGYRLAGADCPPWRDGFSRRAGRAFGPGLAAHFERVADLSPAALALVYGEARLSYGELDAAANRLAWCLRARGVQPGDLVGLLLDRGAELIVAMLAVLKAGGAYVPLDPVHPAARRQAVIDGASLPWLVTRDHLAAELERPPRLLLLDREAALVAAAPAERLGLPIDDSFLAYVLFTSGSTGSPKGVQIPQVGVLRLVLNEENWPGAGRRIGQIASAGFDASTLEIWGALLKGGTLVGATGDDLKSFEKLEQWLEREKVEELMLTTPLLHQLIQEKPALLARLACISFGGERCEPRLMQRALTLGPRLVHAYGPTECSCTATLLDLEEVAADAVSVPIGYALAGTELGLFDAEDRVIEDGTPGELRLGGIGLAYGYLGRPALTAERFVPHPRPQAPGERLYRSGDLVRRLDNGALDFLGRIDSQIKLRGFRIELGEIEAVLARQSQVAEAVALLDRPPGLPPRLIGYFVPQPGATPEIARLQAELARQLPDYMVPALLVSVPRLPLSSNGKVDRAALPRPPATAGAAFRPPASEAEKALAAAIGELLPGVACGLDDDLFDLGLDSIGILQLVSRSFAAGWDLEAEDFYRHRRLGPIAAHARRRAVAEETSSPAYSGLEGEELADVLAELDDLL